MSKDYVVVTAISSFRMRYVMHKDDLQKLNTEKQVTVEMNEEDILKLFDKDNDYLSEWTKDQKIAMVLDSAKNIRIG